MCYSGESLDCNTFSVCVRLQVLPRGMLDGVAFVANSFVGQGLIANVSEQVTLSAVSGGFDGEIVPCIDECHVPRRRFEASEQV